MESLISDYGIELDRLSKGEETTRAANSITKSKTLKYLDLIAMTIGSLNFHPDTLTVPITDIFDISSDSTNDELSNDHCHVCLLSRSEKFALFTRSMRSCRFLSYMCKSFI